MVLLPILYFVPACGVYVAWDGRRSRQQELMWPATPTNIGKCLCNVETLYYISAARRSGNVLSIP